PLGISRDPLLPPWEPQRHHRRTGRKHRGGADGARAGRAPANQSRQPPLSPGARRTADPAESPGAAGRLLGERSEASQPAVSTTPTASQATACPTAELARRMLNHRGHRNPPRPGALPQGKPRSARATTDGTGSAHHPRPGQSSDGALRTQKKQRPDNELDLQRFAIAPFKF